MERDHDINTIVNALTSYGVNAKVFGISERVKNVVYVHICNHYEFSTGLYSNVCVAINLSTRVRYLEALSHSQMKSLCWSQDHEFIDEVCRRFVTRRGPDDLVNALQTRRLAPRRFSHGDV